MKTFIFNKQTIMYWYQTISDDESGFLFVSNGKLYLLNPNLDIHEELIYKDITDGICEEAHDIQLIIQKIKPIQFIKLDNKTILKDKLNPEFISLSSLDALRSLTGSTAMTVVCCGIMAALLGIIFSGPIPWFIGGVLSLTCTSISVLIIYIVGKFFDLDGAMKFPSEMNNLATFVAKEPTQQIIDLNDDNYEYIKLKYSNLLKKLTTDIDNIITSETDKTLLNSLINKIGAFEKHDIKEINTLLDKIANTINDQTTKEKLSAFKCKINIIHRIGIIIKKYEELPADSAYRKNRQVNTSHNKFPPSSMGTGDNGVASI